MSNDRSESLNSIQVRELLEFYSELGLTETINEEPINRFELAKKINQQLSLGPLLLLSILKIIA